MQQLRIDASELPQNNSTAFILQKIKGTSTSNGLFQLLLKGTLPHERYLKIDYPKILQQGKSQNFYFEYRDLIQPQFQHHPFPSAIGLNPRKEIQIIADQLISKSQGDEKARWEQAQKLAIETYDSCKEGSGT